MTPCIGMEFYAQPFPAELKANMVSRIKSTHHTLWTIKTPPMRMSHSSGHGHKGFTSMIAGNTKFNPIGQDQSSHLCYQALRDRPEDGTTLQQRHMQTTIRSWPPKN